MKNHIVDELKSAGMSGAEAELAFNQVAEAMARVIKRGDRVRLPGIGILTRKHRGDRTAFNIRTRERVTVAAHDVAWLRNPEKF